MMSDKAAFTWHRPEGRPCAVCGADVPRLKAFDRLTADATGPYLVKSVVVCFGTDTGQLVWDEGRRMWC